jgi:hypothetical protein
VTPRDALGIDLAAGTWLRPHCCYAVR